MTIGLVAASLIFLVLFVGMYRAQLERERTEASTQINRLLQASLENAMLKRDLSGLRDIVVRLGQQQGISGVMIVNPAGEVRFASSGDRVGIRFDRGTDPACAGCHASETASRPRSVFTVDAQGREVLRSVNPIRNRPACIGCHGSVEAHPVNGVIFVDYDAAPVRRDARMLAFMLTGSGALVVLLTVGAGWWFVRNNVVRPVRQLATATRKLSSGQLDSRVAVRGRDEMAELENRFNEMAHNLATSIRESQRRGQFLQALLEANPDPLRVIDSDHAIVTANSAYCRHLGVHMTDVVGIPCYESSHRRESPCPAGLVICPLTEIARTGKPVKTIHQHVLNDGSLSRVQVYAAPLMLEEEGRPKTLVVESIRDLSNEMQISQEQKLKELDQLATGVAHEIHNPLSSIRLALQAALRATGREDKSLDDIGQYLSTVDTEIDKCIEVTERLMKLSAPPSRSPELVDVNRAISDTVSLLSFESKSHEHRIELDLDPRQPRVLCSDSEIRMIVLNFVQNAFHAMSPGDELRIATSETQDNVEIIFEDTGCGIQPGDLPHIYDPFFSRRADGEKGTGLGLSIAKAIIERYGGTIEVRSGVGVGTLFEIRLPRAGYQAVVDQGACVEAEHIDH